MCKFESLKSDQWHVWCYCSWWMNEKLLYVVLNWNGLKVNTLSQSLREFISYNVTYTKSVYLSQFFPKSKKIKQEFKSIWMELIRRSLMHCPCQYCHAQNKELHFFWVKYLVNINILRVQGLHVACIPVLLIAGRFLIFFFWWILYSFICT